MTRWLDLRGFAARYSISKHTAYKLVRRGLVPFGRIGRKLIFDPEECDAAVRQRGNRGGLVIQTSRSGCARSVRRPSCERDDDGVTL